jgi:hypothetical protein
VSAWLSSRAIYLAGETCVARAAHQGGYRMLTRAELLGLAAAEQQRLPPRPVRGLRLHSGPRRLRWTRHHPGHAQNGSDRTADPTYLRLPLTVSFKDYSDLALLPNYDGTYQVAVTSQESKALWIGRLSGTSWSFLDDGT